MEVLKARIPLMGQGSHAEFVAQTLQLFVAQTNPQRWGPEPPRYNIRVQNGGNYHVASAPRKKSTHGIFSRVFFDLGHPDTQLNADAGGWGHKGAEALCRVCYIAGRLFFPYFHNSETSPRFSHACVVFTS